MGGRVDFRNDPLTDMVAVGRVEARQVQIWLRAQKPGEVRIEWWPEGRSTEGQAHEIEIPEGNDRDHTAALLLPGDGGSLEPLTRYRFRVTGKSDRLLGEGRFETAPASPRETPSRFSLALFSCNQPFNARGSVRPSSALMLKAARRCMGRHETKFVLAVGDQMYSDFPEPMSLFDADYFTQVAPPGRQSIHDCSAEEVRRLFHRRYRHFWNQPDWQALHTEVPCYPILDDHDLVDNWGSRPAYQTSKWRAIGQGGMQAYFDYQGSRVLPPAGGVPDSFHYCFTYGNTATFVMDLRSQRTAGDGGQLYGKGQEEDLRRFLAEQADKKVIFIVISVPVVHLPRFLAKAVARLPHTGEDFSDRWSSGAHVHDRDRFLKLIHAHQRQHPSQRVVLLSGDIHIGCVHVITWPDGGPALYQMISSPITHQTGILVQWASRAIIRANRHISTEDYGLTATVRPLRGEKRQRRNPFGKMNLGLIEVETKTPDGEPTLRFLLYGNRRGEPVCVFRSPAI